MNCTKATALMLDYLYDELGPRKRKSFEKHLRTCANCSKELAAQRVTVSTFGKLQMEEPSADLTERVTAIALRDIEQRALLHTKSPWYWKPALAAAAVGLVAIVSIAVYLPQATKSRMETQKLASVRKAEEAQKAEEPTSALAKNEVAESKFDLSAREEDEHAALRTAAGSAARKGLPAEISGEELKDSELMHSAPTVPPASTPAASPPATSAPAESELRQSVSKNFFMAPREQKVASKVQSTARGAGSMQETMPTLRREMKTKASAAAADKLSETKEPVAPSAQKDFLIGNMYFDNHDFNRAAMTYQKVIDLEPKSELAAEAWYRMGQSYQQLTLYAKAIAAYDEIIQNHPDFDAIGDVYIAIGDCYLAMGRVEDALHNFEIVRDKFARLHEIAVKRIDLAVSQQESAEKSGGPTSSKDQ